MIIGPISALPSKKTPPEASPKKKEWVIGPFAAPAAPPPTKDPPTKAPPAQPTRTTPEPGGPEPIPRTNPEPPGSEPIQPGYCPPATPDNPN